MLLDRAPRTSASDFPAYFSAALIDPEQPVPPGVTGPRGKGAVKRYNVYRNNFTVSLIDALGSIYPAIQRLTGVEFFRAMARFHVRETPPDSPLLFEYGRDFPAFIERYEYARELPWLADVARIERAWLDAYHAADDDPLSADALAGVPPDQLSEIVFVPHSATRVIQSAYSAATIFVANRGEGPTESVDASEPEAVLITRPHLDVMVRHLPPGAALFLQMLVESATLGEAATAVLEEVPTFDIGAAIAAMIEAGAFTTLTMRDPT